MNAAERLKLQAIDEEDLAVLSAHVQDAILKPLRDGAAVMAGVKTALEVIRDLSGRAGGKRSRTDEEDALFIG